VVALVEAVWAQPRRRAKPPPPQARSISSPSLWEAAYALIIAGEGATALGFAGAAALLLRHLRSPTTSFNRAKGLAVVAAGLGFLVWSLAS